MGLFPQLFESTGLTTQIGAKSIFQASILSRGIWPLVGKQNYYRFVSLPGDQALFLRVYALIAL